MPPAWWVEPLVALGSTVVAVSWLRYLMSQPEDSTKDKP